MYTSVAAALLVGLRSPHPWRLPHPWQHLPSPTGGTVVHVGDEIHGLSDNGTIVHVANSGAPDKPLVSHELTGWITYAQWNNLASSPITSFSTTFTVPPAPESDHGQTVFLWNGFQPNSRPSPATILQYGPSDAGGGSFWSVASWYIVGNSVFYTNPAPVNPGDVLTGIMTLVQNGTAYNYNAQFVGIPESAVDVVGTEPLGFATITLEGYSVTGPSHYPIGSTVFSNTSVELGGGVIPEVSWAHVNDAADGITTTINSVG
ncbi:hypothetical protein B0H17DRAFT_1297136 [Mycena rosella]|uniref:Uncharacterized protein n=1 Tax=Mycena rosella TaxID=1033263 RepID=A0AAD7DDF6_MYCRO|nr:hypothetical protein B0H17DRAFT_1297136 [Mycena rosella]